MSVRSTRREPAAVCASSAAVAGASCAGLRAAGHGAATAATSLLSSLGSVRRGPTLAESARDERDPGQDHGPPCKWKAVPPEGICGLAPASGDPRPAGRRGDGLGYVLRASALDDPPCLLYTSPSPRD